MTFLLRYWKPLLAILAVVAVFGALRLYGLSQYREGVADTERKLQERIERERETQRVITEEIQHEHQATVSALQGRVNKLLRRSDAIRLCEPAPDVPSAASESPGSAGTGPALRAGQDLQPRLVVYGGQCEQLRQQLLTLRQWYDRQAH